MEQSRSKRVYDACVSTGDKKDGTGKYWTKVGTVFQNEKGLSLKLEVLPLAKPGNDGYSNIWINFFVPTERDNHQQQQSAPIINPQAHPQHQPQQPQQRQVPANIQSQFPDAVIQQQPTDNTPF